MICIVVLGTCQCLQAYPQLLMCALTVTLDNHIVYLILLLQDGDTPLIAAVREGHDEIEQFLISNGATNDEKYKVSIELQSLI